LSKKVFLTFTHFFTFSFPFLSWVNKRPISEWRKDYVAEKISKNDGVVASVITPFTDLIVLTKISPTTKLFYMLKHYKWYAWQRWYMSINFKFKEMHLSLELCFFELIVESHMVTIINRFPMLFTKFTQMVTSSITVIAPCHIRKSAQRQSTSMI
jgi:hypothetical protein